MAALKGRLRQVRSETSMAAFRFALAGLLAWVWISAPAAVPLAQAPVADRVLVNGRILTVDASDSIAQAIAIADGKIAAVGTNDAIRARAGAATEVIDLRGRTATPGLIDSHVHFSEADALYTIDLSDPAVKSINDVISRVRASAASLKPGEWVRGRGWDEGKLVERRYITAADLDKAAPDNPVWLTHTTGHYGVANSYALKVAGVERETKDPPAGTIDRDEGGKPTGVMKEAAMGLVTPHVPQLTREQQKNGILTIIGDSNAEGMTGAKDPGIGENKWELYKEILGEGKLTVRVFALWSGGRSVDSISQTLARIQREPRPPASFGDGRLLSGGVKLFMDGSGGARTAWMYSDWNRNFTGKDTGNHGYPTTDPEVYRQMVRLIHDAGVHVSTHAIGDHAIDWVVDTYDQLLKAKPTRGLRHGIIHANTPTDHAIDTMARLQRDFDAGYPEAQATFLWWLGDNYAGNLGPERAGRLKPFRTFLRKGVKWGGGSDYGVTPFAARYSLWASVVRTTLNGTYGAQPFGTAEAVDIKSALRSQTIWAAHQMFLDDRIGSIEVGKDADIAVWDRDLYTVSSDALKDLKCEMTLLKGNVVFSLTDGR
jgi:predicted amidohydrolase YtcJ